MYTKVFIYCWDSKIAIIYNNYLLTWNREDAGFDVFVSKPLDFTQKKTQMVSHDIVVKVNAYHNKEEADKDISGNHGMSVPFYLFPRSSIWKTGFRMCNSIGLIDRHYRGTLGAPVDYFPGYGKDCNLTISISDSGNSEVSTMKFGDRYFQITPSVSTSGQFDDVCVLEWPSYDDLQKHFKTQETSNRRLDGGFGSTGSGI